MPYFQRPAHTPLPPVFFVTRPTSSQRSCHLVTLAMLAKPRWSTKSRHWPLGLRHALIGWTYAASSPAGDVGAVPVGCFSQAISFASAWKPWFTVAASTGSVRSVGTPRTGTVSGPGSAEGVATPVGFPVMVVDPGIDSAPCRHGETNRTLPPPHLIPDGSHILVGGQPHTGAERITAQPL